MSGLHCYSSRALGNQAHLRLLGTADLHMHIYPYDYYADRPANICGLSLAASAIRAARREADNTLLFDNGDFLQGNPLGDYAAYDKGLKPGEVHPIIAAMNTIGYDAATVGNHDFNYGLDFLQNTIAAARFPVVAANIAARLAANPRDDAHLLPPYVILRRALRNRSGRLLPIQIGVIGFTPPQIVDWDRRHLDRRVEARDIVETARIWAPEMRAAGADIVIALAHTGFGAIEHEPGQENAAFPLAQVPEIDALLIGHSHLVFPSTSMQARPGIEPERGFLFGKPAVMPGFWGSHLGVIDLLLEQDTAGKWHVGQARCEARPTSRRNRDHSLTPLFAYDPEVLACAAPAHRATLKYIRRPVGRSAAPIHSYFALLANDPASLVIAAAQRWHVQKMLAGTEFEGIALLSAAAPFKTGGRAGPDNFTDVPAGELVMRNIADLYQFPNTVHAVKITGEELHNWLERSVGAFNTLAQGQHDQLLLNPEFPGYNFDVISGVQFEIDLSQPARFTTAGALQAPLARRIQNLTHEGKAINPRGQFIIATNCYRANGGGGFPGTGHDRIILKCNDTMRDVLVRFIAEHGTLRSPRQSAWTFRPMPQTSAVFETGPGAKPYLPDIVGAHIEALGTGPNGFARYRVYL